MKQHQPTIRPYQSADKEKLLELLRLNTPVYFDPSEESGFVQYLEELSGHHFVVEKAKQVVGTGSLHYALDKTTAYLAWDIIHPNYHGQGIGKTLTLYRINQIKRTPSVQTIIVRTSQLTFPFYQKLGFTLEKTQDNYWAKGIHLYYMKMNL